LGPAQDFGLAAWTLAFGRPASPSSPRPASPSSPRPGSPSTGPAGHPSPTPLGPCPPGRLDPAHLPPSLSLTDARAPPFVFLLWPLGHDAAAAGPCVLLLLDHPLLSQKRPPPSPIQIPPVAPGSSPETATQHHQWCRLSSLHPTASPPSSSPYKRARSTPPAITTLTLALPCLLPSLQPSPHRAPTAAAVFLRRPTTSPPHVLQ
jgi:hypothetical protein